MQLYGLGVVSAVLQHGSVLVQLVTLRPDVSVGLDELVEVKRLLPLVLTEDVVHFKAEMLAHDVKASGAGGGR